MRDLATALFSLAPKLQDTARRGRDAVMIQCPFHGGGEEKTPSCSVSLESPVFFCHACQESGHISRLLRTFGLGNDGVQAVLQSTGLDKPYTVQSRRGRLAARVGSHINALRGPFILDEDLLDDYRHAPRALMRSGFEKQTLRHFEVGYDSTNMRITFPLRNIYGELVGISGRALLDIQEQKYRIYDQELKRRTGFRVPDEYTMEDVKDSIMWHAHVVRPFFYSSEPQDESLVLTEGFKACMWVWQSGWRSVVALIGMYMSDMHTEILASSVQDVVLFLDNNEAGWRGTVRAGRLLSRLGIVVRVAKYPDDRQQPDALSSEETTLAIAQSEPYLLWRQQHVGLVLEDARSFRSQLR